MRFLMGAFLILFGACLLITIFGTILGIIASVAIVTVALANELMKQ